MEDPWVNAWGDPQKSSPENSTNPPPTTVWTPSSKFVTDDQADIAIPSWEPDSGAIWDDSPDLHNDLWSRENRTSQLWTTPTFDSIGFAKPSQETQSEIPLHSPSRTPSPRTYQTDDLEPDQAGEASSSPEVTATPAFQPTMPVSENEPTISSPTQEGLREASRGLVAEEVEVEAEEEGQGHEEASKEASPDPDGFGTFEAAAANDYPPRLDPWTPSQSGFSEVEQTEEWGTTWKEPDEDADNYDTEPVDEWELAKRQKEMQDRYVPPELLDSILHHFNEFAGNYWPEEQSEGKPATYQHDRKELAETLGITTVVDRLIPSDLTLPVSTAFTKTFISKEMIEALKLTRHHLITRNSPLAIYVNSKGSLSWEAAVKSKPDVTETDVVPTGWRIVPKETTDQQSMNDTKRKTTGGLLSFFGRKSTTNAPASGSSSPVRSNTPGAVSPRSSIASPRPSVEVNAANSVVQSAKVVDTTPPATMSTIAEISATSKMEANVASAGPEELAQAPSAVSRFFGRFSRSNRSPNAKPRNSIALSSDDLEFLSDIVPSANDEIDEVDKLDALSNMIRAPLPTKLPPPLAPPPRAPPLPRPISPPSFASSRPITPTVQHPQGGTPLNVKRESVGSQLFDLDPSPPLTPPRPGRTSSQTTPASLLTVPPPQASAPPIFPPPLPSPLSATSAISRSHISTTKPVTAPAQSAASLFDDDDFDFSDFQTSPTTSTPLASLDSAFASFTAPAPVQPARPTQQSTSFDDFDDFVSPEPPQVPEKLRPVSIQPLTLLQPPPTSSIFRAPSTSIPHIPSVKSSSPPKQLSIHQRRSSKQLDSHQRTLSLLETAAARGKWPAPPSPLPNTIPPPSSMNTESNLFDLFDEPNTPVAAPSNTGSNLASLSNPIPSHAVSALPPSGMMNRNPNTARGSSGTAAGTRSTPARAKPPPLIPPPLIPPQQSMKPIPPPSQIHTQPQQQWRIPSPPTTKPLPSFVQMPPSTISLGNGGNASASGSRSNTPIQPSLHQQKPSVDAFSSLLTPAVPLVPQAPGGSSKQNAGSNGGRLSAQDLSFFENL